MEQLIVIDSSSEDEQVCVLQNTQNNSNFQSVHVIHFNIVVNNLFDVRKDIGVLYTAKEHKWISTFRNTLSIQAQGIYLRMFQRKGPWFGFKDLLKYKEVDNCPRKLRRALNELRENGFIEGIQDCLPANDSHEKRFPILMKILKHSFTIPQLVVLLEKLQGGTKLSKAGGKVAILERIGKVIRTQRKLDGSRIDLLQPMMHALLEGDVTNSRKNKSEVQLVALEPQRMRLFLRLHALFYFRNVGDIATFNTNGEQHADRREYANDNTAISFLYQAMPWPGLLSMQLGEIFPKYTVCIESPLIHSLYELLAYEAAVDLLVVLQAYAEKEKGKKDVVKADVDLNGKPWLTVFRDWEKAESLQLQKAKELVYYDLNLFFSNINSADQIIQETFRCMISYDNRMVKKAEGFLDCVNAGKVLARCLGVAITFLESQKRYELANTFLEKLLASTYRCYKRGTWWIRYAINLKHLGKLQESEDACRQGLQDPYLNGGDIIGLSKRLARFQKSKEEINVTLLDANVDLQQFSHIQLPERYIHAKPLNCEVGDKSRFIGYDDEGCSVEELAVQYYQKSENGSWFGLHCEGSVIRCIFGLLFWDAIYKSVPDVFQTPFQTSPLDIYQAQLFYDNRKDEFENILQELRAATSESLLLLLGNAWRAHFGTQSLGIRWDRYSLHFIQYFALGIGAKSLAILFDNEVRNFAHLQAGMPDVAMMTILQGVEKVPMAIDKMSAMLLDIDSIDRLSADIEITDPKLEVHVRFSEVKGPRDRLADRQTFWIKLLLHAGIDAEVLHVREKKTKNFSFDEADEAP